MKKLAIKKVENLSTLSISCSPCLKEAKKIQKKIGNRSVSEIKLGEIKQIVKSLFNNKNQKHRKVLTKI